LTRPILKRRRERLKPVDTGKRCGQSARLPRGEDHDWRSHGLQGGLDLYNVTNSSTALNFTMNYVPGGAWLVPTDTLPARFIKFSMQADF
jgi:hypothetical protein